MASGLTMKRGEVTATKPKENINTTGKIDEDEVVQW